MITTKMVSPIYSVAVAFKEHTLSPFTCFTWSTMINQKTALNTSLDNVTCSANITIAYMPYVKLLLIENVLQLWVVFRRKNHYFKIQHILTYTAVANVPPSQKCRPGWTPLSPSSYATGLSSTNVHVHTTAVSSTMFSMI